MKTIIEIAMVLALLAGCGGMLYFGVKVLMEKGTVGHRIYCFVVALVLFFVGGGAAWMVITKMVPEMLEKM